MQFKMLLQIFLYLIRQKMCNLAVADWSFWRRPLAQSITQHGRIPWKLHSLWLLYPWRTELVGGAENSLRRCKLFGAPFFWHYAVLGFCMMLGYFWGNFPESEKFSTEKHSKRLWVTLRWLRLAFHEKHFPFEICKSGTLIKLLRTCEMFYN